MTRCTSHHRSGSSPEILGESSKRRIVLKLAGARRAKRRSFWKLANSSSVTLLTWPSFHTYTIAYRCFQRTWVENMLHCASLSLEYMYQVRTCCMVHRLNQLLPTEVCSTQFCKLLHIVCLKIFQNEDQICLTVLNAKVFLARRRSTVWA